MPNHKHSLENDRPTVTTFGWMVGGFVLATMATAIAALAVFEPDALKLGLMRIAAAFMSPFLLEFLLFMSFLCVVCLINWVRRRREGSEWVYLAEDHSGEDSGQPGGTHDAMFSSPPEPIDESDARWAEVDGMIAMKAYDEAAAEIAAMPENWVHSPRGLRSRIALANASGKPELAGELERKLDELG